MKIEKHITITETHDIDIIEITLLSLEEAIETDINLLRVGAWWWLRSPGYFFDSACYVSSDGNVDDDDDRVTNSYGGVRPALRFEADNIAKGDVFTCAGYDFTVISNNLALCNSIVGKTYFQETYMTEDAKYGISNVYENSNVKKWLERWVVKNKLKTRIIDAKKIELVDSIRGGK